MSEQSPPPPQIHQSGSTSGTPRGIRRNTSNDDIMKVVTEIRDIIKGLVGEKSETHPDDQSDYMVCDGCIN